MALREALEFCRASYDFIVIDAPPNLGMLTWMALAAAEDVIIPVRTEPYDTMGVGLILSTIKKVPRRVNLGLRLAGILPTSMASESQWIAKSLPIWLWRWVTRLLYWSR